MPEKGSTRRRSAEVVLTLDTILRGIRTAELDEKAAQRIVEALKGRGLVELAVIKGSPGSAPFVDFLTRFWTYDGSPYVKEMHAHGHRLGRRHCLESLHRVKHDWAPRFSGRYLGDITKQDLKRFGEELSTSGLAPASINKIVVVGTRALKWAAENGLIESNPGAGLMRYTETPKKRGVLTPEEAKVLFAVDWPDERARVANLVAATTGLRAGEVRALQVRDIGQDRLFVRHSWSDVDGMKSPKNGEERVVPLVPSVREELLNLARVNPYGLSDDTLIFYSILPDKPCEIGLFLDCLKEALVRLSAGNSKSKKKRETAAKVWKDRGIVFHSWPHFYAARLADRVDIRRVSLATGHKSAVMAEHYAAHALDADFEAVGTAVAETFGTLVSFRKPAANM